MNKEENKIFLEKFILNNPFDFKQGIINHCRQMDKIDVYEWVAEDELKIQKLQQENEKLKEKIENLTTLVVCGDTKQIKNTAQYKLEQLQQRIDKAIECISNFLCTEEYIKVDGIAIADNYEKILEILDGGENNR